ncbi:MAG: hypothetical protein IJV74_04485 [Clostridia bacterium]|nr:hypothetical protein [Clostridia bacterium]
MRGYQRKIIHLKNTGSYLFDEAYFVLSRDGEDLHLGEDDMVKEASRIIDERNYIRIENNFLIRNKRRIMLLLSGALSGAAVSALLFLIF